ncbi:MAG TPA: hypothetical protein PLN56_11030 [Methanoregulaceae archaeon]|jgi:hypothetical protein|nr:hypothetical protein [Methanoregulaceae archaeon]
MKAKRLSGVSLLFVVLMVSGATLVPAVSASKVTEQHASIEQLAAANGILLKHFDSKDLVFEKVGQRMYFSGTIAYEAEAEVGGTLNQVKSTDLVQGYLDQDGTYHVTSSGQDRSIVIDVQLIDESEQSKTYLCSQQVIEGDEKSCSNQVFTVPRSYKTQVELAGVTYLSDGDKIRVDLPSAAPYGSIKVLDDVKASQVQQGSTLVAIILTALGLPEVGAVFQLLALALEAIADYGEVDMSDIYVDFFITLGGTAYAEVDYFYY